MNFICTSYLLHFCRETRIRRCLRTKSVNVDEDSKFRHLHVALQGIRQHGCLKEAFNSQVIVHFIVN